MFLCQKKSVATRFYVFTGIPQPIGLQGFPTNTNVILQWQLPGYVQQDDLSFNVRYIIYQIFSQNVEFTSIALLLFIYAG